MDLDNLNKYMPILVILGGYFGFILRDVPQYIWSNFKNKISSDVQINTDNSVPYNLSCKYLVEKYKELTNHIFIEESLGSMMNNISEGYYFFYNGGLTWTTINLWRVDSNSTYRIQYNLNITFIGLRRNKLLKEIKDYIALNMPSKDKFSKVTVEVDYEGWNCYIPKKDFKDIYFYNKNDIMKLLDKFIQSTQIYIDHGIIHKMGILLYGEPGTGKSVLSRAIADYIGYDILYISPKCKQLPLIASNKIILFEDIDCLISNSNREDEQDNVEKSNFTLQELLNYIDGVVSPHNVIFLATTNYIDRLDSALIRQGRFDYKFELQYMDKELAKQMCDNFNMNYDILENIEFPCSPAVVQNKIIKQIC